MFTNGIRRKELMLALPEGAGFRFLFCGSAGCAVFGFSGYLFYASNISVCTRQLEIHFVFKRA